MFANSMLALDAETGKLLWYFQGVHHDIWDRDFPSPPALVTVRRKGKSIDAVAQTTKQGWVFLFDRTNGQSLFPIEERKFPRSTVPGEVTSPTQPVPLLPAPYTRQVVTENTLTNRTPQAHAAAVQQFRTLVGGGQFVPGVLGKATILFPGVGWRRGVGWIRCRSQYRDHLYQCKSSCFHDHAGQERSLGRHWPPDVSQPVCGLSWCGPFRRSAGLPFACGCVQPAYSGANYRHHPSGQRKNVLFPRPSGCEAGCLARVSPDWQRHWRR